jgi:hypothetical protein
METIVHICQIFGILIGLGFIAHIAEQRQIEIWLNEAKFTQGGRND